MNDKFTWGFPKNEADYIFDTLSELGKSLKEESENIFDSLITITDLADNSRTYAYYIIVPELSGFSWRLLEVNKKNKFRKFKVLWPSSVNGPQEYSGSNQDNLITIIQKIIKEREVSLDLATYYNRVVVKRKSNGKKS
jgi:hypothetical protein